MMKGVEIYAFQNCGGYMKALVVIMLLMSLYGCKGGEFFPEGYGHELAYKCDINPYDSDCLQPPPIYKGP
jgi:hypothetical protein